MARRIEPGYDSKDLMILPLTTRKLNEFDHLPAKKQSDSEGFVARLLLGDR